MMKDIVGRINVKMVTGIALGAIAGFSYYYFIGCSGGTCPITSSPVISTLYGAMLGWLAVR